MAYSFPCNGCKLLWNIRIVGKLTQLQLSSELNSPVIQGILQRFEGVINVCEECNLLRSSRKSDCFQKAMKYINTIMAYYSPK